MTGLNKRIGKRIREIRKYKNISIEKMAENLNVSYSTYQRIETGETSSWAFHLDNLSKTLNVAIEEIVLDKELITQNNNDQLGGIAVTQNMGTINALSEKLIDQFELRIKEKDETIESQNKIINDLKKLLDKK